MEEIVKTTRHTLLKRLSENEYNNEYNHYWVRITTDGINGYGWYIGYKNRHGLITCIEEVSDSKAAELEKEFKETLEKEYQEAIKPSGNIVGKIITKLGNIKTCDI